MFKDGREEVVDEARSGRPSTSRNEDIVKLGCIQLKLSVIQGESNLTATNERVNCGNIQIPNKYADIVFVYGYCDGNARAAVNEYASRRARQSGIYRFNKRTDNPQRSSSLPPAVDIQIPLNNPTGKNQICQIRGTSRPKNSTSVANPPIGGSRTLTQFLSVTSGEHTLRSHMGSSEAAAAVESDSLPDPAGLYNGPDPTAPHKHNQHSPEDREKNTLPFRRSPTYYIACWVSLNVQFHLNEVSSPSPLIV
ncbi:hypothetical protein NQ318_003805 [Aromia moschata]|uniref:Uncharacterized protein n=1 Tax=Aromia moschata TaxID=1265417 RepID=A0AAV8XA24_9CUCU|nr:hypothetical protein NQ318_003805 [Aromia moschata]